tara:strand:+ start:522 stop:1325 length:804 start_codon:yes stop_codon:yes gene_type:complete
MECPIHVVTDLHIDNWDKTLPNPYPCGKRSYHPMIWEQSGDQSILVIAGDVSDDIDITISYLNKLTSFYDQILFVEGNHESCVIYPKILDRHIIGAKVESVNSNSIHFLSGKPFILNGVAFVGKCGWWDYQGCDKVKDQAYFDDWMPHLSSSQVELFHQNVDQQSRDDYLGLVKDIEDMQAATDVERIIVVTHTIPHRRFSGDDQHHILNHLLESIDSARYPKIDTWLFGHIHEQWDVEIDGIRYIANPRGRVDDFNRTIYKPMRLQ